MYIEAGVVAGIGEDSSKETCVAYHQAGLHLRASGHRERGREGFFIDVKPLDRDEQVSTECRTDPIGTAPIQEETLSTQVKPESVQPIGLHSKTKSLVRAGASQETETHTHHRAGMAAPSSATHVLTLRGTSPLPNTISQTLRFLHPALPLTANIGIFTCGTDLPGGPETLGHTQSPETLLSEEMGKFRSPIPIAQKCWPPASFTPSPVKDCR